MSKLKILYISHEIDPFLKISKIGTFLRKLPQDMQERGIEIRILIPRFGLINERKHRLHEVVRLSGLNISVGEDEKPLIIKVASIPTARLQVYFLDNEDYFQRKTVFTDKNGVFHEDNDDRAIFFCKGALETVKKLGWSPDIVHCADWMTSFIPLYLKTTYKNDPIFKNAKVVFSVGEENTFEHTFSNDLASKVKMIDVTDENLSSINIPNYQGFIQLAAEYADVVVKASPEIGQSILDVINSTAEKHVEAYIDDENYLESHFNLYSELSV
jgi:starch synthase